MVLFAFSCPLQKLIIQARERMAVSEKLQNKGTLGHNTVEKQETSVKDGNQEKQIEIVHQDERHCFSQRFLLVYRVQLQVLKT